MNDVLSNRERMRTGESGYSNIDEVAALTQPGATEYQDKLVVCSRYPRVAFRLLPARR